MNICCLNVSSKMCFHYAHGATATVEPYPKSHRQDRRCGKLMKAGPKRRGRL